MNMYIRDYFYRDELKDCTPQKLREEWEIQRNLILNDKEYLRPNNRMTMNIIEDILESRGEKL
jgi:hypothetical protein